MSQIKCEVWLLRRVRVVLIAEAGLGVPVLAVHATDGTIGGTIYRRSDLLATLPLNEACRFAGREACKRPGYRYGACVPSAKIHSMEVEFVTCREVLDQLPGKPDYLGTFPRTADPGRWSPN